MTMLHLGSSYSGLYPKINKQIHNNFLMMENNNDNKTYGKTGIQCHVNLSHNDIMVRETCSLHTDSLRHLSIKVSSQQTCMPLKYLTDKIMLEISPKIQI